MKFPIDFPFAGNVSMVRNKSNLDFASLNRGFPDFRSRTFRKILTLRGSCKTNFSNLRVFESLLGSHSFAGKARVLVLKYRGHYRKNVGFPL